MTQTRIQFGKRYDHFVGNGTQEHYAPGDFGTFDEKLANSLMYEGFAVAAPSETEDAPEANADAEDRETKVTGPQETKPEAAKSTKGKK